MPMEKTSRKALDELTGKIIRWAMKVHGTLGAGFLEPVYKNALTTEPSRAGHVVECERRIQVLYEGNAVGVYYT